MRLLDFWPTDAAITKCVPSEAEVISDEAFLAVHQPIRLLRRSLTNTSAPEEPAGERKVLDALLTKHLPEGYVIVPVVGPSGVGKSHLIRWLGLHVPRGKTHVIPIPKSTSLRQILETILKGLAGAGYDEIRKQLATAREALDEIAARNLLLAHFRTALERRARAAEQECVAISKRHEKPPAELAGVARTHGPGLVALLEGPTKDALLQDEPKKSVFRTLITRVTTGIIAAENGEFTADDFRFDAVNPAKLPDVKLQNYVKKLKANTQNDRATAARLMNEVRDWAVGQLLGLGENQLADLFRRVREELYKDGRELVLLIEDFTTLAGVQQGLLDVIKMEGVRAGEAERCPLRTALAVTEGYLSPYDTLKTRIGYEFVLREQPAAEPELLATITDMAGAYLNAARLGPERLKDWFEGANRDPDAPPPSFESAAKDLSDPDRKALEAFEKSDRGHSLFPFNRAAVKRLALQHLAAGGPLRLNPRALIKEVLHTTLLYQREAFERRQFPPEDFHKFNPNKLGFEVTAWLAKLRKADHGRYAVLLGYWADQPRQPGEVRLPAPVYTAFGLVPLTDAVAEPPAHAAKAVAPTPSPAPPPTPPSEVEDETRAAIAARERMLDEWAESKKITQRDATNLRNDLLDMIDWAIDWDAELFIPRDLNSKGGKLRSDDEEDEAEEDEIETGPVAGMKYKRIRLRSAVGAKEVYLPFNPDKTGAGPDEAIFTLCREDVFADPVAFAAVRFELRALVRFHAHKSFEYPGGDEDRAWYARLADRAAAQAVRFLRGRYERVPDNAAAVAAVAQALYVSARALDLPGAHSNVDSEVLKTVLHPGPTGLSSATSGEGWHKFRAACATHRGTARDFLLRRLAARQGAGNVLYGIDASRLLDVVKPVRKTCRVETKFPGKPERLDDNARQVLAFVGEVSAERTDAAVAERRAALVKWAADTRAWLGGGFRKDVFVADCRGLLNQASNLQVYAADVAIATLRDYLKDFDDAKVSEAISAVDRLKDAAGAPSVELTAVVQAPDGAMRTADTFRAAFQAFEQQTLARARAELTKKLKLAKAAEDADPDSLLPAEAGRLDCDLRTLLTAAGGTPEDLSPPGAPAAPTESVPPAEPVPSRFAALRATLDRLSRVDTVAQQLQELEPVRSAVNGWADELPRLVSQYALFSDRADLSIDVEPDGAKVVSAAAAARKKVAEGPLEITRGRTFTNLKSAVEKVVGSYRETIDAAWVAWVQKNAPRIDDAELAPFEADPEYRQAVADLKAKRGTLRRHEKEPAESQAGFQEVEGVIAELRTLRDRLPITAPDEVKTFLAATNSKDGAPIDLLTDPVRAWLRENNQTDKYRIRR
jgi:hypothetical protein